MGETTNNTKGAPGPENRLAIPLENLTGGDLQLAGGKAVNLGGLISMGFPVPPGFAITSPAYRVFLTNAGLVEKIKRALDSSGENHAAASKAITAIIMSAEMPDEILAEIRKSLETLGGKNDFAVRSSSAAEDTDEASFAGVYETYLNVRGADAIIEAVKRCWASMWAERALAYRSRAGFDHLESGVGVVVQVMVPATASGIMFTTNPVTAHPGEIVVDAVSGLGEAAVSGRMQPDHFVVRKSTGEVKQRHIVSEKQACSEADLKRLAEMGRRIEQQMGSPQDVEWAIASGKIFLLQSRPVTTLPPADEPVFTRKMGDQYWTDVLSPMSFTCGVNWIVEGAFIPLMDALGFQNLHGLEYFKLHKSHLYMNTAMARETISMFPESGRKQFAATLGSPHDDDYLAEAPYRPFRTMYAVIKAHIVDKNSGMARNLRLLEQWSYEVEDRTARMLKMLDKKPDLKKLVKMFEETNRMGVGHFEVIRWGHASYNTSLTDMFRDMCEQSADDEDGSLFFKITGHVEKNITLDTDQALWETARAIGEHPDAREIFSSCTPEEAAHRLLDLGESPPAARALKKFLDNYGHRTTSRDITAPHWRDTPEQIAAVIKGMLAEEFPPSPVEKAKSAAARSEEGMAEAKRRIMKKWYGLAAWPWFKYVAEKTRLFIGYRENQRFTLDRIIFFMRRLALAIGEKLALAGLLDRSDDVFFLHKEELFKIVRSGRIDPELKSAIPARRRAHADDRDILPPAYLKGNFEFDERVEDVEVGPGEYAGLNAAPGVVEGTARVLTELRDSHTLRSGEILVTESTDPAWSAAFMKVAGLVLETGGILSHGAILAREFGVPAVTHVPGAVRNIKTGDRIRVDGSKGRVTVIRKAED